MSESYCASDHMNGASATKCEVCGKPIVRRDLMTMREMIYEARRERAREAGYEDEEEYYG